MKSFTWNSCVLLLCCCLCKCEALRILGIFPFEGKSHFVMFEALMKGLADKGHRVDVISCFPLKKPYRNYNDIGAFPIAMKLVNNMSYELTTRLKYSAVDKIATIGGNNPCEYLKLPALQKLIRDPPKDPPYDVVLIEVFGAHCYGIFGYLYNVPVVGVSSSDMYPWMNQYVTNPENYATVPNLLTNYVAKMNFWQRLYNVWSAVSTKDTFNKLTAKQDEILKKYIGPDVPGVRELEKNISLILLNSHIAINSVRSMTPAVIEVAGLHVKFDNDTQLRPVLQKWMDDSTHGIIYVSFGSMVKIESFPKPVLQVLYNSFAKLAPVRVLMKIANPEELPPGLPANVLTQPWLEQSKILRHKNVKVFVTHGGLMGTQEAIAYGVPMIGIPLFADQYYNIDNYVHKKIAIKLNYETMTEKDLTDAVNTIMWDPTYRQSIRLISSKFVDRPLTPLESSEYWIRYVVKHGYDALRSPAADLAWWQVELLDIYAFILLVALIAIYLTIRIVKILVNSKFPNVASSATGEKKLS